MHRGAKQGRHGMLEGNWVEEMALREIGGTEKTTFERVLGHTTSPTVSCSLSNEALAQSAALAARTNSAAYRYLRTEKAKADIWKQAMEEDSEKVESERKQEEDKLKGIQYGNWRVREKNKLARHPILMQALIRDSDPVLLFIIVMEDFMKVKQPIKEIALDMEDLRTFHSLFRNLLMLRSRNDVMYKYFEMWEKIKFWFRVTSRIRAAVLISINCEDAVREDL
jgi:hypothetical protein